MIILILDFPEESDVFDKSGFNMFIIHELAKNIKLFPQKLVSEIYLEEKKNSQIKKVSKITSLSSNPSSVDYQVTCMYMETSTQFTSIFYSQLIFSISLV